MLRPTVVRALAILLFAATPAAAFEIPGLKERVFELMAEGRQCAGEMSRIGFKFDEIRTELDLTPKVEIYFRDVGGSAFSPSADGVSTRCMPIARALLKTRDYKIAGFRLAGVRLAIPGLRVTLLHAAAE